VIHAAPPATATERGGNPSGIVASTFPVRASRRHIRRSRASPSTHSEPSPTAISRNWARVFSPDAGSAYGRNVSTSLRSFRPSVLSRCTAGHPAAQTTPSPDAIAQVS